MRERSLGDGMKERHSLFVLFEYLFDSQWFLWLIGKIGVSGGFVSALEDFGVGVAGTALPEVNDF